MCYHGTIEFYCWSLMLTNPTTTQALAVKPHCLTLTVLWVLKDSLVLFLPVLMNFLNPQSSPLLLILFTSSCTSPPLSVTVCTEREPHHIINHILRNSLHPKCRKGLLCAVASDRRSNCLLMEGTQPHRSLKMNGDKLSALIITHTHTWVQPTWCYTDKSGHLQRKTQVRCGQASTATQ